MVLDELDKKIISKLKENAIVPFVKIAKELGVAEGTIRQRVKKLMNKGVIRRFTIDLDAASVGIPVVAFLIISVAPGKIQEVVEDLKRIENIVEIHEIHTFGDFMVKVRASDLKDLGGIISEKVKSIKYVSVNNVIPVLNIWKDSSA